MRSFLTISTLLFVASLFAQSRKLSFVKYRQNILQYASDSSSFMKLFEKMDRIAKGENEQVRVVHIGGSHVQAGIWSGAFVDSLQRTFISRGGGFFTFPYKVARTNGPPFATTFSDAQWQRCRPVGKEYCQPLGVCAMNITTQDSSGTFGVKLTDRAYCRYVNKVKIFHGFDTSITFFPATDLKYQREDKPEEGYSLFAFDMPFDSLNFHFFRVDTVKKSFTLYGISMENDLAPGFYLAALGANGASTSSFLRAEKLASQLPALKGDLFIFSLGVNDTQSMGYSENEFQSNYDSLITLVRTLAPDAAILLTTTTDNYIRRKYSNKRTVSARNAMMALKEKHPVAVWDLFSVMGGYRSMLNWTKVGLAARDKVHFNAAGYRMVAYLMYDAFMDSYKRNRQVP